MVASTLFNNVIFPAGDRNRLDQLRARCLILSTIDENKYFFFFPKSSANPRYFPTPPSFSIPRICFTFFLCSWEVCLPKEIDDFWPLICWPEALPYLSSIRLRFLHELMFVLQKNIVSSSINKWLTLGDLLATRIPCSWPVCCALMHSPDSTWLQRMNKYGDRGSPCLIPLLGKTSPLGVPLIRKEYVTVVTHSMIHLTHFSWNPSL